MKAFQILSIAAIIGTTLGYNPQHVQTELTSNWSKWTAQAIQDYNYKHTTISDTSSGQVYPFSTQVRNGASVSYLDGNNQPIQGLKPQTLNTYFSLIQNQLNAGAHYIDVTYDPKRGFPTNIYITMADNSIFHAQIFDFDIHGQGFDRQQVQDDLNSNRAKWQGQAIANYDYSHITHSDSTSGAMYPFSTQVRNGVPVSYVDGNNNGINWLKPQTLEIYFNMIQQQLDAGAQMIEATYDSKRGFPTMVYVEKSNGEVFHADVFGFSYFRRLRGAAM